MAEFYKNNYFECVDNILCIDAKKYKNLMGNSKAKYNGIPEELLLNILDNKKVYKTFLENVKYMYIYSLDEHVYKKIKKYTFLDYDDNINIIDIYDILQAFYIIRNDKKFESYKSKIYNLFSLNIKLDNEMYLCRVLDLLTLNSREFDEKVINKLLFVDLYPNIKGINFDLIFSVNNKYFTNKNIIKKNIDTLYKLYLEKQTKKLEEKNHALNISIPDEILDIIKEYININNYIKNNNLDVRLLLSDLKDLLYLDLNFFGDNKKKLNDFVSKNEINLKLFDKGNTNIKGIALNNELKVSMLNEIPFHFSKLQKMYYLYRRLCQKFSYDEEYLVLKDKSRCRINHLDENRIIEINDNNNKIVCFEASFILAKFCELFDIPYYFVGYLGEAKSILDYRKGKHIDIRFKADNYIVNARMVVGTIENDLCREKTGMPLQNFNLDNNFNEFKEEFELELKEVDNYITNNIKRVKFVDAEKQYKLLENRRFLNNDDKLKILMKCIKECNLEITDSLRYILNLKKIIFKEVSNDCDIAFVKNKNPIDKKKKVGLLIIISYNNNDIIEYYTFESGMEDFKKINRIKLQLLYKLNIISNFEGHLVMGLNRRNNIVNIK